jgi:hypothetical protein
MPYALFSRPSLAESSFLSACWSPEGEGIKIERVTFHSISPIWAEEFCIATRLQQPTIHSPLIHTTKIQ